MKRALVLGGGGSVGIAWETALLAGMADGGTDVGNADLVVGTSAGSIVGAHLAHGHDPREQLEMLRSNDERASGVTPGTDMESIRATFSLWSEREMTAERCAQVGALALRAKTADEDRWVQSFVDIGFEGWPERLFVAVAVDCESGELAAFDRSSGVSIERALAASCSVPALFPPVTIDGRRYTDGGVRSGTSAQLAGRIQPDRVLIIATIGAFDRGIHKLAQQDIPREKAALEADGARVRVVMLDDATRAASGENLMNGASRLAVADAGFAQGRRIAGDVAAFWDGE